MIRARGSVTLNTMAGAPEVCSGARLRRAELKMWCPSGAHCHFRQEDAVFEICDFTTSTPWEKLISQVEQAIRDWRIADGVGGMTRFLSSVVPSFKATHSLQVVVSEPDSPRTVTLEFRGRDYDLSHVPRCARGGSFVAKHLERTFHEAGFDGKGG